jgi:hypothetical protein
VAGAAAAVAEELATLAPERRNSALAALALSLGRDLDTAGPACAHPSLSAQLRNVLDALHVGPRVP